MSRGIMSSNDPRFTQPSCGQETTIGVVQAKVEMLIEALVDVKDQVRRVAETVNILRMLDVQMKRQAEDHTRLLREVESLAAELKSSQEKITKDLEDARRELTAKIGAVDAKAGSVDASLKDKVSYVKGALAVFSVLGVVLYGLLVWLSSGYISTTKGNAEFIQRIKVLEVEEHLKDVIGNRRRSRDNNREQVYPDPATKVERPPDELPPLDDPRAD